MPKMLRGRNLSEVVLILLFLGILAACTALRREAVLPSGNVFWLEVEDYQLFLDALSSAGVYPEATDVRVHVRDAQGRPIDGAAVAFSATVDGQPSRLSITPERAVTQQGLATARFEPGGVGIYRVAAQVEQHSRDVEVYVNDRRLCCLCQRWPNGHRCAGGGT